MSNTERFKQAMFFCPFLAKKHVVKEALKKCPGDQDSPTILENAKFEIVQNQAISVLDSDTGKIKILCPNLNKEKKCLACDVAEETDGCWGEDFKPCSYAK